MSKTANHTKEHRVSKSAILNEVAEMIGRGTSGTGEKVARTVINRQWKTEGGRQDAWSYLERRVEEVKARRWSERQDERSLSEGAMDEVEKTLLDLEDAGYEVDEKNTFLAHGHIEVLDPEGNRCIMTYREDPANRKVVLIGSRGA